MSAEIPIATQQVLYYVILFVPERDTRPQIAITFHICHRTQSYIVHLLFNLYALMVWQCGGRGKHMKR